jgi:hypothetical protein
MGCLIPAMRARLFDFAPWLRTGEWTEASQLIHGSASLWVLRVVQPDLAGVEPFRLGVQALRDKVRNRAQLMFFVVGVQAPDHELLILATYAGGASQIGSRRHRSS